MGSCSIFQGIFPTQGSNLGLQHCRWILYQLSHKGNLRILEWVAFSSRSPQPRNWTGVSCLAGKLFTNWAITEALCNCLYGKRILKRMVVYTCVTDSLCHIPETNTIYYINYTPIKTKFKLKKNLEPFLSSIFRKHCVPLYNTFVFFFTIWIGYKLEKEIWWFGRLYHPLSSKMLFVPQDPGMKWRLSH